MKLRIAIATETRAEYGLLRPVYRALDAGPKTVPTFLVSGMHHLRAFGRSIEQIAADGVRFRRLPTLKANADGPAHAGAAAARAVAQYARALADFDWLIVLGDRVEMLAAAVAATALGKPIAHLHGGDVAAGARDDAIRHAITKLAHLHFPATPDAARRIRRLGEQVWRVRLAGAPAIDALRQLHLPAKAELDRLVGFSTAEPFAVVVQHAAGFSPAREQAHLRATLDAVAGQFAHAVVIAAGFDAGSDRLGATARAFVAKRNHERTTSAKPQAGRPIWAFFPTLPQREYFGLLARAAVLVGNSSSGMIESATFKLPVVNVGPRQRGRLHSSNVIDCDYGRPAVARAIHRALADPRFRRQVARCRNLYGPGHAGRIVADAIARTPIGRRLLVKLIDY